MRLTTAFKLAGFKPTKVFWDKRYKANRICALFDGKKSMGVYQFQGTGKYQLFDTCTKDFFDEPPLLEIKSDEGEKLLKFLTGDNNVDC